MTHAQIHLLLQEIGNEQGNQVHRAAAPRPIFHKTGPGQYAEHDRFIGVNVPTLRKIAKQFQALPLRELQLLLISPIHEERLLALVILVAQYQRGTSSQKEPLYQFYLQHLPHVNNWNLVDSSAHHIIGAHLLNAEKELLLRLAESDSLWDRRIAIVATWYFIRHDQHEWTLNIAAMLLRDREDLIHKAVGWMLREVGKRRPLSLLQFLDQHATQMPRTMLRYAIEKFPEAIRQSYLQKPRSQAHLCLVRGAPD